MNNLHERLERSIEILKMKQQEIRDAKMAHNRGTVWSDTERYKLNMEMLTWIVNTDTLFLKTSNQYSQDKQQAQNSDRNPENKEQEILLGLYHAFNCFKHNARILSMETINTDETIKFGDTEYTIANNKWSSDPIGEKQNTYKFYKNHLKGKNVEPIFNRAVGYLVSYYNKGK
ncbi:hypothetical protein [Virgibacillus sp. CBA3643]|uniref:hypothetical protein n=1 Tax=Virgibacillus sp. CBA3643 TaxID=2942278 RepID=UPI0035A291ED